MPISRSEVNQDGSSTRHIDRQLCQGVAAGIISAHMRDDLLGVLECWLELRNQAEQRHVWQWLTVKQRDAIREAKKLEESSGMKRRWRLVIDGKVMGRFGTEEEGASWVFATYGDRDVDWRIEHV